MEQGHQRRPLAAGRHILRAEVVDDGNAEFSRQQGAVADLPGAALLRPMQDGVAVEADHVDVRGAEACRPQQHAHGLGVIERDLALDRGDIAPAAEDAAQALAQGVGIGQRKGRAAPGDGFAIGDQQRRIDAVERGAAHQTETGTELRHARRTGGFKRRGDYGKAAALPQS